MRDFVVLESYIWKYHKDTTYLYLKIQENLIYDDIKKKQ